MPSARLPHLRVLRSKLGLVGLCKHWSSRKDSTIPYAWKTTDSTTTAST